MLTDCSMESPSRGHRYIKSKRYHHTAVGGTVLDRKRSQVRETIREIIRSSLCFHRKVINPDSPTFQFSSPINCDPYLINLLGL